MLRSVGICNVIAIVGTVVAVLATACAAPETEIEYVEVTRLVHPTVETKANVPDAEVIAGEVRGVRFTMGDLVERIRVLQGINRYQGGQVDFSRIPFQLLTDLLHAEILRQAAPGLSIDVTDALIDDAIRNQFRPEPGPGQEVTDEQLDAEFDNTYKNFLTQVNLTDDAYRRIMEERLHQSTLFGIMLGSLPEEAPQVELQAIALSLNSTASPEAVRERLVLGEDFGSVSREISGSEGYIGWVPEGAFPEFDSYIFGANEVAQDGTATRKPALLEAREISAPIYIDETIFIIQTIGGPETRDVEAQMLFQMASARVEQWKDDQLQRGSEDGWVKINFDSNRYAWVTDQVRLTASQAGTTASLEADKSPPLATRLPTSPQSTSLPEAQRANLWVYLRNHTDYGWLEVYADPAFDIGTVDLNVLVDGTSFLNPHRIYEDDGPVEMCCSTEERPHNTIMRVSAQTPIGDLKCQRNSASDSYETVFACAWR